MGSAVIGCDICQDVCPWNRKAPITAPTAFQPREAIRIPKAEIRVSLLAPELEWLASLSQQEFSAVFRGSAVKRAKWQGLVRNACIALGNSTVNRDSPAFSRVIRLLESLSSLGDLIISDHARWALARLSGSSRAAPVST